MRQKSAQSGNLISALSICEIVDSSRVSAEPRGRWVRDCRVGTVIGSGPIGFNRTDRDKLRRSP